MRFHNCKHIGLLFLFVKIVQLASIGEYYRKREEILSKERSSQIGYELKLNKDELRANATIMKLKIDEYSKWINDVKSPFSENFLNSANKLRSGSLFKIIRHMPKGGLLHIHIPALTSLRWLLNQTYRDDMLACVIDNTVYLKIADLNIRTITPNDADRCINWKSANEYRKDDPLFDQKIVESISLLGMKGRHRVYSEETWDHFRHCWNNMFSLFASKDFVERYYRQMFKELIEDNVQYVEMRLMLSDKHDTKGRVYDSYWEINLIQKILADIKREYPDDFIGARIILNDIRFRSNEAIHESMAKAKKLVETFPDMFVGFDLVGHEDIYKSLLEYIHVFEANKNLSLFLHAGETNYFGTHVDENLIDAILLGSQRIGHGLAIPKHPEVMKTLKDKKIAIEVCPVSNQVLGYVPDLLVHPATVFFANNLPVVISSDDPSMFNALPLSDDFYAAFMVLGGRSADLATMKQLAINSIQLSAMDQQNKMLGLTLWQKKWDNFIDWVLEEYFESKQINGHMEL